MNRIDRLLAEIGGLKSGLHAKDLLLTWQQTQDELKQVLKVAEVLKLLRAGNVDTRVFRTGIGVSIFMG